MCMCTVARFFPCSPLLGTPPRLPLPHLLHSPRRAQFQLPQPEHCASYEPVSP